MRDQPPAELVAQLAELSLATAADFARARGHVRRLARGLPAFASVWVDALALADVLTPWQAAEINADRANGLVVGPYVLRRPLPSAGWARAYLARHCETGVAARVVIARCPGDDAAARAEQFARLLAAHEHVTCGGVVLPAACGHERENLWCAAPALDGISAVALCSRRGRLPGGVVREIARQMCAALADLSRFELVHGDVSIHTLLLGADGRATLVDPLVRSVVRPTEGFGYLDVPPEAADALAPERVRHGSPPDTAGDLYACGLAWWHLLTGRPALAGGDSLSRLQAACEPRITPVERVAPDAPRELVDAIRACLAPDPADRPASFAELSAQLGRPTVRGRRALEAMLSEWCGPAVAHRARSASRGRRAAAVAATAGPVLVALALLFAPPMTWLGLGHRRPGAAPPSPRPAPQRPLPERTEPPARSPVVPARFEEPAAAMTVEGNIVRLPAGRISLARLRLSAGQVVAPPAGHRATCVVDSQGLVIEGAQVRFENIDFVHAAGAPRTGTPALVDLRAAQAHFAGCTFAAAVDDRTAGTAIVWQQPALDSDHPAATRLELTDCVFRGASQGIAVRHDQGVAVVCRNGLFLGPGPAVLLKAAPRFETPVVVACRQFTLREAGALVEVPAPAEGAPADGTLRIEFSQSVFAPPAGAALLVFDGQRPNAQSAGGIAMRGDSSVVQPGVLLAAWRDARRALHPLGDEELSVEGLVRGAVEFAGPARGGAKASLLTRWQVPLVAEEPPGIVPARLAW